MQCTRCIGSGGIDDVFRRLWVKTATPTLNDFAPHQHLSQEVRVWGLTAHFGPEVVFQRHGNFFLEWFFKTDRPLGIQNTVDGDVLRGFISHGRAVPKVRTMGRQVVDVAAIFIGAHLASPAVTREHGLAHRSGVGDFQMRAAFITENKAKGSMFGYFSHCCTQYFANQLNGKASLRGHEQI